LKSKILEERIRRVKVLFTELGYRVERDDVSAGGFTATFRNRSGIQGGVYVDEDSRFLELGYTFTFSSSLSEFLKTRLESMIRVCYEYGCYLNIQNTKREIAFSIFTKIYFSGLNYDSLKDSLRDFRTCAKLLTSVLDISLDEEGAEGEKKKG
jgi:hypothetical protein